MYFLWVLKWCALQKRHFMYLIYKLQYWIPERDFGLEKKKKESLPWLFFFWFPDSLSGNEMICLYPGFSFPDFLTLFQFLIDCPPCDSKAKLRTTLVNHLRAYHYGEKHLRHFRASSKRYKIPSSRWSIHQDSWQTNTKASFYLLRQSYYTSDPKVFEKCFPIYNVI